MLNKIESQMSDLGATLARDDNSPESGITVALRQAEQQASLVDLAKDVEQVMSHTLSLLSTMAGSEVTPEEVDFKLNTTFTDTQSEMEEAFPFTEE